MKGMGYGMLNGLDFPELQIEKYASCLIRVHMWKNQFVFMWA